MGVRVSVKELVEVFRETYRAIDIRTAANREGEAWVNALTVVRVTYEAPEAALERLRRLEGSHGPIKTERFRIVTSARPFTEWKELREEIGAGILRFGDFGVRLRQPLAVDAERNQIEAHPGEIRPFDETDWPALRLQVRPHQGTELIDEVLTREVNVLGYSDAYEAINSICEVNVRQGQSHGYDFYLSLPAFIRVVDARVLTPEKRLDVIVKRHHTLHDIKGVVVLRGTPSVAGQPHKARIVIEAFSRSEEGLPIETVSGSVELPEIEPDDWVDVRLTHPKLGELDAYFSRGVRWLIPLAERNFLFEALRQFCPDATLDELLVHPYAVKPKKMKPSAVFELHVAWVLGLFGCPAVVLGEYERFIAPETKVELGSVDILALTPSGKTLLLVACTLTAPEDRDFNNLRCVRGILGEKAFKDTTCRILPVVFTAARECPSHEQAEGTLSFIPIVNAEGIAVLLALLRTGHEKRFFEFLNDPRLSPLRRPREE